MSKNKKKSNLKNTSAEAFSGIIEEIVIDPAQIDLEEQIADEVKEQIVEEVEEKEYKPRFKIESKNVIIPGYADPINNQNLDEATKCFLIDSGRCKIEDFI